MSWTPIHWFLGHRICNLSQNLVYIKKKKLLFHFHQIKSDIYPWCSCWFRLWSRPLVTGGWLLDRKRHSIKSNHILVLARTTRFDCWEKITYCACEFNTTRNTDVCVRNKFTKKADSIWIQNWTKSKTWLVPGYVGCYLCLLGKRVEKRRFMLNH